MDTWQIDGEKVATAADFISLGSKITVDSDWSHKPRLCITKQRYHFADKGLYNQSYSVSSSQIQMRELDHKEGWMQKNWFFWTVVLEKTLESSLDRKGIKPVNPKGNQPWIFIGRTDAETEAPIPWLPDAKSWLIRKDPEAEKDWGQE